MRKLLLLAVVVAACARSETASTTDSAAGVTAAPVPLRAADLAGNWQGTNLGEGDSVLGRWTAVRLSDSTGKLALEGAKDSIDYTMRFDGDSMIATSVPYVSPSNPKAGRVVFRSTARLKDGRLMGTTVTTLASNPDSVIARNRWEATRAP